MVRILLFESLVASVAQFQVDRGGDAVLMGAEHGDAVDDFVEQPPGGDRDPRVPSGSAGRAGNGTAAAFQAASPIPRFRAESRSLAWPVHHRPAWVLC